MGVILRKWKRKWKLLFVVQGMVASCMRPLLLVVLLLEGWSLQLVGCSSGSRHIHIGVIV